MSVSLVDNLVGQREIVVERILVLSTLVRHVARVADFSLHHTTLFHNKTFKLRRKSETDSD